MITVTFNCLLALWTTSVDHLLLLFYHLVISFHLYIDGCLFGVVFYKDSSTSFQSINPLPVSSSSTARAMTLRLSALNGSV